jgi:hypothetical protein
MQRFMGLCNVKTLQSQKKRHRKAAASQNQWQHNRKKIINYGGDNLRAKKPKPKVSAGLSAMMVMLLLLLLCLLYILEN